ncbi:Serine/threonine-protein kinase PknD [subsurface metagenome]
MPDMTGHTLGPYRILEMIGVGGMAEVYKAYQPAMDRYVAIKVIKAYFAEEQSFPERRGSGRIIPSHSQKGSSGPYHAEWS